MVGVDDAVATGDWFIRRHGVFERLVARPGERDLLVQLLLASGELVAKAPGCYMYLVSVSGDGTDVVWVTEAWRSEEHRKAAYGRPGPGQIRAQAEALIELTDAPIHSIPVGGKGLLVRSKPAFLPR
jgi:quinol monooxygenase YgiN